MNMNVGSPNSVSSYHRMTLEEYQKLSYVPTRANLEKRQLEQDQAALQDQQQDQRKSRGHISENPLSTTLASPQANSHSSSRPEVRRLSGNFNAPTYVELERHNNTRRRRSSFREIVKGWAKKSPPPTVV
ncbi:uncharacterized protein EKO05_0004880 [Ascochyta rabiei]|uniref:Uncharacterized protein n=1 Tax=Didymella rabiei TaxID=5454 RepID=A0A163M4I1_DIDRA|nr:uncharacterized protein EKO05_0004880 [Ascochyta rabiei]KZM28394.1 hypothetical protein ST47_g430 [Ascochyta rabiei]UPX14397.1 hypothetical protein EKO05_0004880 [Ascochyta rabiei]